MADILIIHPIAHTPTTTLVIDTIHSLNELPETRHKFLKGLFLNTDNLHNYFIFTVFSDSKGERQFAHDLDEASEVVVYAKLPRTFQIPTPVGNYAPDWAIAMKKNDVKHIFFMAETKGSMSSMDLSAIERAKIDCAEKLCNSISTANVKYHKVATYQDLIDGMNTIGS